MSLKALQDYTFISKYSRYLAPQKRREVWDEAVDRMRDMHIRRYPQVEGEIRWAFEQVRQRRVLGSQRALQYGGTPIEKKHPRIYNCFEESTPFITSSGVRTFADFQDGDSVKVLSHLGEWRNATVRCYGKQTFNRIVVGRGAARHEVVATADHRWILKDGTHTTALKVGDALAFAPNIFSDFQYESSTPMERLYWVYGYVYGDGTLQKGSNGEYKYSSVRLCGHDKNYVDRFRELGFPDSSSLSLEGDRIVFTGQYLKTLPDPSRDDPSLIRAFVRGYLDADGTKNSNVRGTPKNPSPTVHDSIQATGKQSIDFIRACFPIAGVYIVSEEDKTGEVTNFGERGDVTIKFRIINGFGKTAASFKVLEIEENIKTGDAWCLEVEEDRSFVLPFGLPTGNCIVSYCDRTRFFQEAFWLLLCGSGVGFSVQKHHIAKLPDFHASIGRGDGFSKPKGKRTFVVPDTIEGWADALGVLLATFMPHPEHPDWEGYEVEFDYSQIRPKGSPLSSGVGKAPGPEPLRRSLDIIHRMLVDRITKGQDRLRSIDCYDVLMHASDAVLSGGVRRSATICLFSPDDEEMLKAKFDYVDENGETHYWHQENPQRARSNNSVVLVRNQTTREQFEKIIQFVKQYGEPGFVWTDSTEMVVNPCVEIGMYPTDIHTGESGFQACNLCEINGSLLKTREDFITAARAAAIIGTLQAGYTDFDYLGPVTKKIVEREALLGVSMTGMMDNPEIAFDPELQREMAALVVQVNEEIAEKIGINPAARATCVKPAGNSSALLGTGSGIHPHPSHRYIRNVQANAIEAPFVHFYETNPDACELSVWNPNGTDYVISFLIEVPKHAKIKSDFDAVGLLERVKLTQQNWVMGGKVVERCTAPWLNHNVSNTVTVRPDEWERVADYIYDNREFFAGISLLPSTGDKDYPQAPFTNVLSKEEILSEYQIDDDIYAKGLGLVKVGLFAFEDNLWRACDGISQANLTTDHQEGWVRLVNNFAKLVGWDTGRVAYFLKDVYNWDKWCRLSESYRDVDYMTMIEDEDNTKLQEEVACAGGACLI